MMSNRSSFSLGGYLWYQVKRYAHLLFMFNIITLLAGPLITYLAVRAIFMGHIDGLNQAFMKTTIWSYAASSGSFSTYFFAGLLGIIFAIVFSRFLQDKKQSNFFHSLPVKRHAWFLSQCLVGFVLFTIINLVTLLVTAGVYALLGGVTAVPWLMLVLIFLQSELFFITSFAISMLAGQLVGNVLAHVEMIAVLHLSVSAVGVVLYGFMSSFFKTFAESKFVENLMSFSLPTGYLSHMTHWQSLMDELVSTKTAYFGHKFILSMLVVSILAFVISMMLYKMRQLEHTSETLVFKGSKLLFKIFLGMISGAALGLILYQVSERSMTFLAIGIIFGVSIFHLFFETAVNRDARSILKLRHWVSTIIIIALTGVFASVFVTDTFGYDTYLPKSSSVVSVNIDSLYSSKEENTSFDNKDQKVSLFVRENIDSVIALAAKGIEKTKTLPKKQEVIPYEGIQMQDEPQEIWFKVTYQLAEGGKSSRQYEIDKKVFDKLYADIYGSKEYRKNIVTLYQDKLDKMSNIEINDKYFDNKTLAITENSKKGKTYEGFKKAFLADMLARKLSVYSGDMEATIYFTYEGRIQNVNVYQGDKQMMAFLKNAEEKHYIYQGSSFYFDKLPNFSSVVIEGYDEKKQENYSKRITDKKMINTIIKEQTKANSSGNLDYRYPVYGETPDGIRSRVRYFEVNKLPAYLA